MLMTTLIVKHTPYQNKILDETMNHSVWQEAYRGQTLPEVGNRHRQEIGPFRGGSDACFLHAEPSTMFHTKYQFGCYRSCICQKDNNEP